MGETLQSFSPFSRGHVDERMGAVKQVTLTRSGCPVLEDKPSHGRSQVALADSLAQISFMWRLLLSRSREKISLD